MPPPAIADRTAPEQLDRRRKAESNARWATEISELKTEGRTPRHFRTNPHE